MILDYENEFTAAGGQAVTAAAIGAKVMDGGAAKDWGSGEALHPYARVTGAAASNPGTSMTIDVVGADDAALTTNPVVLSTKTVAAAALTANSLHQLPALLAGVNKRFLGMRFTPNGGNATTGRFVGGLLPDKNGRPQNGVNFL